MATIYFCRKSLGNPLSIFISSVLTLAVFVHLNFDSGFKVKWDQIGSNYQKIIFLYLAVKKLVIQKQSLFSPGRSAN